MKSYEVRIWDIGKRTIRGKTWYRIRWTVAGASRPFEELFQKKALANSFRAELIKAANDGQPFDTDTGRPYAEVRARNAVTWYVHVREYMERKWPRSRGVAR